MRRLLERCARMRGEGGGVTVEFVLLFPLLMAILLAGTEMGVYNLREMMLRHAVNEVVRGLRISTGAPPAYGALKHAICVRALFTEACLQGLRVELRELPMEDWVDERPRADCLDRSAPINPANHFNPGAGNRLMIVRVCSLFDPLFPGAGVGRKLAADVAGEYGIRVDAAFVTEPP